MTLFLRYLARAVARCLGLLRYFFSPTLAMW